LTSGLQLASSVSVDLLTVAADSPLILFHIRASHFGTRFDLNQRDHVSNTRDEQMDDHLATLKTPGAS